MPESTQDDEAYTPTTEFHNFLKLPVELQFMIWRFYWPPTRHFFSLDDSSRREYAAVDVERKCYVNRVVPKDKDHVSDIIPFLSRIQLVNKVKFRCAEPIMQEMYQNAYYYVTKCKNRPVVCVDFVRDTFYFNCCSYMRQPLETIEDEWFRVLHNPINRCRPPQEDHWIFKVRNLALFLPRDGLQGSSWDHSILQNMKSLKSVLLVTPQYYYFAYWDPTLYLYCNVLDPFFMADEVSQMRSDRMRLGAKLSEEYLSGKMKEYGLNTRLVIAGYGKEDDRLGINPETGN